MDDLTAALAAARIGAEVIRPLFGQVKTASFKGAVDPVTEADHQAERAILDFLANTKPGDAVLAEEEGGSRDLTGRHWLVDPLDGTVNFLHGIPQVAVSVALFEDGLPVVAAVVDVLRGEEFTAAAGMGAKLDGAPISVSKTQSLGAALVATGFPYDRQQLGVAYASIVGGVLEEVRGIRRLGSAALDLAWLAAGRYDGYWEFGLGPWDVAAGMLLIIEAGGRITDHEGNESAVFDDVYVAAGQALHPQLLSLIDRLMPSGWPQNR